MRLRLSPSSALIAAGICAVALGGLSACSKKAADPVEATASQDAAVAPADQASADAMTSDTSAPAPTSDAAASSGGATTGAGMADGSRGGPGMGGPMTRAAMLARSDERFDRMDTNHDGVLSAPELAAMADGRGGGGGRGLARADANNDGRVTRAEARASATERFARMDTNNDGVISEDERPQWGGRGGN